MKKTIKYFLPENGQSINDCYDVDAVPFDLESAAAIAAEDYFRNHDGWEASWPQTICVELEGKTQVFKVNMEAEPHFYASEIKQ